MNDSDEQEGKYFYGVFTLILLMKKHKMHSIGDIFEATVDDTLKRIEDMSDLENAGLSVLRCQYSHLGSEVLATLEDRVQHHSTWASGRDSNQQDACLSQQCTPSQFKDTHGNQDASAFSARENHDDNGHFTSNDRCSDFPLTPDNDNPTCDIEVSEEEHLTRRSRDLTHPKHPPREEVMSFMCSLHQRY